MLGVAGFFEEPSMKMLLAVLASATLAACGVETATTAAAVATMKKQEMDQAKKTMEQATQKIEQNTQLIQQGANQSDPDKAKE
jgi:hypothetical protein